jgi:ABC-type glycerol-3-phosphate transport system substrate-binding protein
MTFRLNDPETKEIRAALNEFEAENPSVEVELESFA